MVGVVSAGVFLAGGPASAAPEALDMNSALNVGIANGIQAYVPVQVPVNVCGVALGLLGSATATCHGSAVAVSGNPLTDGEGGGASDWNSALNIGIANGIQAAVPVQVPVNACGVAVGLLGDASADCTGNAVAIMGGGPKHDMGRPPMHDPYAMPMAHQTKAPKKGVLGKVLGLLPLEGLLGKHGHDGYHDMHGGPQHSGCAAMGVDMNTFGNVGIANGIQAFVPVQVPVNANGIAVGLGGSASATGNGSAVAHMC
jgi:hypothetical protein